MFKTILVANRGEIAARIIRTLRRLGIEPAGVASDADRFAPAIRKLDKLVRLGSGSVKETYLDIEKIIAACHETGAQAVHPGYGLLSENARFAERLRKEGITFIGPRPEHIRAFGLKHTAREIAQKNGVPLLPGSGILEDIDHARFEAAKVDYPVIFKSTAGGGGIGMQLCLEPEELEERFASASRLAESNFGDARLYLERYITLARHIEVQIFGDGKGNVIALGERDCSLQRRNQKVIEETPAPHLSDLLRAHLQANAIALGKAVGYESAGTVEFVYDVARDQAFFLEVNTRLQVEHPVTEEVYGIDLVEWMIRQAAGEFVLPEEGSLTARGHAIEARLYAENPSQAFRPSTGRITDLRFPKQARIESWVEAGTEVSPLYDPMLAKIIVHAETREEALAQLDRALGQSAIWGIETNLSYLGHVARSYELTSGNAFTSTLKDLSIVPRSIEVLAPGAQTTLQDWPGRIGYWHVGVPPCGPMDERSHRLVNRIVGNAEHAATLECTLTGPTLKFSSDTIIALGGAQMSATLDGQPIPYWVTVPVAAGQTLAMGRIQGPGMRTYIAVFGGLDAPLYLGSRSTFTLGGFGGHATGALKSGDTLQLGNLYSSPPLDRKPDDVPELTSSWEIGVLYGPHGAPDFFTDEDIEAFFSTDYEVHYNSARTGVRLIGPAPKWARPDGGEAGLHPSNIHDTPYAIGAIDFTGDMPIILGPDGPSLGGFVCPAAIALGEIWKIGQLKPGDKVRFFLMSQEEAVQIRRGAPVAFSRSIPKRDIVKSLADGETPVIYRRAGDDNLLVEYGPMVLNLKLRLRVHLLMEAIKAAKLPGIIDLTPGIRSLQVHYGNRAFSEAHLLEALAAIERELPDPHEVSIQSRIVHLPLSWNDPQAQLAMRKYQELVRPNAPWCPSNIEFIRRINGLESEEDVKRIVFDANYLVLGLGDVYLGAPVATPTDPRHRLVTTKYNPARTWTPENAVGIGGAYLCVYGMEGPGGYQLFGRTIQMWNSWRSTDCFEPGTPWLLRFFDQIRFYPVSGEELLEAREAFPHGRYPLRIEECRFTLAEHERFLAEHANSISAFKTHQQQAFDDERRRWRDQGLDSFVAEHDGAMDQPFEESLPEGASAVHSSAMGTVWKVEVTPGDTVMAGQTLIVIESMKMEIAIPARGAGVVRELRCQPGRVVKAGQVVALIEEL